MDFDNEQRNVRFDEENRMNPLIPAETSLMVLWVMKYSGGLVKNEKQANSVLIGIVVVAFALTLFLFLGAIRSPSPPSPEEIINVAGPEETR